MSIGSNIAWAVTGKVVTLLSGLLIGILVARYLGPEQYGTMNYVISFVFLFQTISIFGLDSIEIREEAKANVNKDTIIGTALGLRLGLSVLSIVACIATCVMMGSSIEVITLVAIYSTTILLNTLSVIRNYFFAIVQNKRVVQSEIARTLVGMVFKFVLLGVKAPLAWFVFAQMFDFALLGGGYILSYRKEIGRIRNWKFDINYLPYLVKEAFPLLLTSAAVIIYQRIDQVMIGDMINEEQVGYFSVAVKFVEILVFIPMILGQTISPILVKTRAQDMEKYHHSSQRFMNISVWCSVLAATVTSLIAHWLITILFGEAYLPAVAVLQVMAFKAASVALSSAAGQILVIEGLQKYAIFRDMLGCAVCIGLNYWFLPRYGIISAAWIAIASNLAAGYLADALIPAYHHIFRMQTRSLLTGIIDLKYITNYIPKLRRQ